MTHLRTARNPMSEARRQHIHGPLLPMDEPTKPGTMAHYMAGRGPDTPPAGELSLGRGLIGVGLLLLVAAGLWLVTP